MAAWPKKIPVGKIAREQNAEQGEAERREGDFSVYCHNNSELWIDSRLTKTSISYNLPPRLGLTSFYGPPTHYQQEKGAET